MKKILLLILGMFIMGSGIVFAAPGKQDANVKANKVLVAYFSATGKTKKVAENLAKATSADVYEIKPLTPYTSSDLNWRDNTSRTSVEMNDSNSRPEIVMDNFSADKYKVIYLGFPIWWGKAPTIVRTFLEKYDFSGKTIVIFATSGSSELGNIPNSLKSSLSSAKKIIKGRVLNYNPTVLEIKKWVESLKL